MQNENLPHTTQRDVVEVVWRKKVCQCVLGSLALAEKQTEIPAAAQKGLAIIAAACYRFSRAQRFLHVAGSGFKTFGGTVQ
jgi:hypothetical protein